MKSTKRILLLTPGFPESDKDSTCIPALQALVMELHEKYSGMIDIRVISFQYPFKRGRYHWHGISCWSAGGNNNRFPGRLMTWLRVILFTLRQQPFQVIHSFWLTECTFIGQLIAALTGTRHIAHIMGQDVLPSNGYARFLRRKALTVIANSNFSASVLSESFNWKADDIIPFGIRARDFENTRLPSIRDLDILAVGSLTAVKNHDLFIDLFEALRASFPGIKGIIIGGGPLMDALSARIRQKGLQECLRLEGKKDREVVLQRMSGSKILLHTAPFESSGYVLLEALYCGMKVVSFKTGFMPGVPSAYPCSDKPEMLNVLHHLLANNFTYSRAPVPMISETASRVFEIYSKP